VARLFGRKGQLNVVVKPSGEPALLDVGDNPFEFGCDVPVRDVRARAMVTVGLYGQPLGNRQRSGDVKWEEMAREVDAPRQIIALDGLQNRWTTVSRDAGKRTILDFELVVHSVSTTASPHDAPGALVIDSFDDPATFADSPGNDYLQYVRSSSRSGFATSEGVTHELGVERRSKKYGKGSLRYVAKGTHGGGWSARGRHFAKPLDLNGHTHIGFWIKGDGLGETLYFQFRDSKGAHFDMKTAITFTGWRFVDFELQKRDFDFAAIEYLILYYNSLPANQSVACQVDAMRAYSVAATVRDPALTVGRRTVMFPTELRTGDVLAYDGATRRCEIRRGGERIAVTLKGKVPKLKKGVNDLELVVRSGPEAKLAVTVQIMKRYDVR